MNLPATAALTTEPPKGLLEQSQIMDVNSDATDESWLRTFGWAKNNPDYDDATKLGEQWRQDVNRQSLVEMDRSYGHSEQLAEKTAALPQGPPLGARELIGFAVQDGRTPRATADWMKELREVDAD